MRVFFSIYSQLTDIMISYETFNRHCRSPKRRQVNPFNALVKKQVADAANILCTIGPNIGIVEVPDERLPACKIVKTDKICPPRLNFMILQEL